MRGPQGVPTVETLRAPPRDDSREVLCEALVDSVLDDPIAEASPGGKRTEETAPAANRWAQRAGDQEREKLAGRAR